MLPAGLVDCILDDHEMSGANTWHSALTIKPKESNSTFFRLPTTDKHN